MADSMSRLQQVRENCEQLRERLEQRRNGGDTTALQNVSNDTPVKNASFKSRQILRGHFGKIYSLFWHSNSTDIVSASQDGKLMVWNSVTANKKLAIPLRSAWVMTCAYSHTGQLVACGGLDNLCSIFRITSESVGWEAKQAYRELQQHEGYLSCCRFVDDSEVITSSGDSTCILWDVETKTPKVTFMDHTGDVMCVSVHGNKSLFVSASTDACAKVWDFRVGASSVGNFTGHDSDINSVQWFPNGDTFVSGSDDSTCRLFDIRAYRQINLYRDEGVLCGVTTVDFSKSGNFLFAGYDEEPFCLCWHTMQARIASQLAHPSRVSCLQTSPNGFAMATGCWDCQLRIWA